MLRIALGGISHETNTYADSVSGRTDLDRFVVRRGDRMLTRGTATFMAGFLDGYVNRKDSVEASLTRGAAAASIVCSRQGANPPTAAETEALMSTRGDFGLTQRTQKAADWQVTR